MTLRFLPVLFSLTSAIYCSAAEVRTIIWETAHAALPAKLDGKREDLLPLIRFGVSAFPEAALMQMTFVGGSALGLPPDKAESLHSLLAQRYQEIASDDIFSQLPSALPYCYSATQPRHGFASVHLPDTLGADSKVIVFLHGYGGSFKFYLHYLADAFPDHIIICPAFGISASHISSAYLQECLDATSTYLDFQLSRPVLIGLSAGGFGGFREYARQPQSYLGYICMASYPPGEVLKQLPRSARIRLVAGEDEAFVKNGMLQRSERLLKRKIDDYSSYRIPRQDHFFMLSAERPTKRLLKKWVNDLEKHEGSE